MQSIFSHTRGKTINFFVMTTVRYIIQIPFIDFLFKNMSRQKLNKFARLFHWVESGFLSLFERRIRIRSKMDRSTKLNHIYISCLSCLLNLAVIF